MYKIIKKEQLSDVVWLMDVEAPLVARHCEPGQFLIAKKDEAGERIPLTICDYDREKGYFSRSGSQPRSSWSCRRAISLKIS